MSYLHALFRLFLNTTAANLLMLAVMSFVYPEPFSLAMDPFSWLGKMVTSGGFSNTLGLVLFSATLLFNACIWRKVLSLLSRHRSGRHPLVRFLGQAVLLGFVLMAFPCDIFVGTHSFGAGLVVGGLWALTTAMLYSVKPRLGTGSYFLLQLVLQVSAIFCGVTFVLDSPLKGFSQRPLLMAMIAETAFCLRLLLQSHAHVLAYRGREAH